MARWICRHGCRQQIEANGVMEAEDVAKMGFRGAGDGSRARQACLTWEWRRLQPYKEGSTMLLCICGLAVSHDSP